MDNYLKITIGCATLLAMLGGAVNNMVVVHIGGIFMLGSIAFIIDDMHQPLIK